MLFRRSLKQISKEELIALAKHECEKEGRLCLDPFLILNHWSDWTIVSNSDKMGCNARVVVCKKSGSGAKKIIYTKIVIFLLARWHYLIQPPQDLAKKGIIFAREV